MTNYLNAELQQRILVLDGSMSARIQEKKLEESDYRGDELQDSSVPLKGNDDVLVLTKPDLIVDVHKEYLNAGADICRTNTLNSNAISQGAYMKQSRVYELNKAAASLAKRATAEVTKQDPDKPRFVAGVVGPTSYQLCAGPGSVDSGSVARHASQREYSSYVGRSHGPECKQYGTTTDRFGHVAPEGSLKGKYFCSRAWREWQMWPSARWPDDGIFGDMTFDEMLEVYLEQICGLMDGGADLLIFEGMTDTLNAKAAIYALEIFLRTVQEGWWTCAADSECHPVSRYRSHASRAEYRSIFHQCKTC
jgi:methionine synthase I (cobalamin-dependent)